MASLLVQDVAVFGQEFGICLSVLYWLPSILLGNMFYLLVVSTIFHASRKDMLLAHFTDRISFALFHFLHTLGVLYHSLHICEFSCRVVKVFFYTNTSFTTFILVMSILLAFIALEGIGNKLFYPFHCVASFYFW